MKRGSKMMYTGSACAAIIFALAAQFATPTAAETPIDGGLLRGEMQRFAPLATPKPLPDVPFQLENGRSATLSDYRGKVVVLNFWASWCGPCRQEMPSLSRLQDELGPKAEVVTIESGPQNPTSANFMDMLDIDNLPLHTDPTLNLARSFGVMGLPVTILISPEGEELGRVIGDAEWDSPEAIALIKSLEK